MVEQNSEMSLDEVLSSIKDMVIADEPPVLELTDMIAEDGSIVKVKKDCSEHNKNMRDFLKFVQEDTHYEKSRVTSIPENNQCSASKANDKLQNDSVMEMVSNLLKPMLKTWIDENASKVAGKILEEEIKKILNVKNN